MEIIYGGWPWYVSGPLVAFTMFLLILAGKRFGMSSNLETICAMGGAGKFSDHFKFDWKERSWGLIVLVGAMIGGFIASNYLTPDPSVAISESTIEGLKGLGFAGSTTYLPQENIWLWCHVKHKGPFDPDRCRSFNWIWNALCWRMYFWSRDQWFE